MKTATVGVPGVPSGAGVPGRDGRDGRDGPEGAATFRIVRGQPTAADLAALTAVLLSRLATAEAYGDECAGPPRTAGWRRPERAAPHRDPRGWRASGSGTG
ncbi:acyl-CoA carboxylase epsilon subunit [Streptomyces sp. NPDC007346]|uniref:acyl-CoA carboxylase epsilon subunit n=1 Tax=Streptomyces sp. NPDC007346 TaxID=3154682 RepID=UPI0034559F80